MTADAVGGVWSYAMSLCQALRLHGVEIVLAVSGPRPSPAQRAEAARLTNVTLHESDFRLEWMEDPWDDVAGAGEWLLALERATAPAVVHLNGYAHAALPWRTPVLVVAHSCVLSWWHAVHGTNPPASWERYRTAVSAGLRAADLVAAPTWAMLDALAAYYGTVRSARVIPNGIDHAGGTTTTGDPIVVAAGRVWDEAKNLGALADAAREIRWPVYVAGSDDHPSGSRRTLETVHHLGVLAPHELRAWYRRASILVHPALYEPFGLVPLEAAVQGCALVLGDISSLREVWGAAACYVDPRDPRAIARAVDSLACDPSRLAHAGSAARARARELSARRMAKAYRSAYAFLTAGAEEMLECAS